MTKSPLLKSRCKALVEAAHSVATPQIRNTATLGGNLCQEVRCWYYRYPFQIGGRIECLRKGGKICNALTGDHRYHSIFGAAGVSVYPCSSTLSDPYRYPLLSEPGQKRKCDGSGTDLTGLQSHPGHYGPGLSYVL